MCVCVRPCDCICVYVYWDIITLVSLAYQKNLITECNQLVYLEISECCVLEDDVRVPAALPDVVHSVSLLEQWIGEQSSPAGELNVYGRLVANSSLYKYVKYIACAHTHTYTPKNIAQTHATPSNIMLQGYFQEATMQFQ